MATDPFVITIYALIVSWTQVLLAVLIVWKIIQLLSTAGKGIKDALAGTGDSPDRTTSTTRDPSRGPERERGRRSGRTPAPQVEEFQGRMVP